MPRVQRWSRVNRDLTSIIRRIARDNPTAAHQWLESIEELFQTLAAHPTMSAVFETRKFGMVHGARDQEKLI